MWYRKDKVLFILKEFSNEQHKQGGTECRKAKNNHDNNVRNSEIVEFHDDLTEAQDTSASNYKGTFILSARWYSRSSIILTLREYLK